MTSIAGRVLVKASMRSADLGNLADQIQRLEQGGIDALHFDVMDGQFVPEICFGPLMIRGLRKFTTLPFEVHLLVAQPDGCLDQYLDAGTDTLLFHVEVSRDPLASLTHIHKRGHQAGLATVPGTPAARVAPYLEACDCVNVMTVVPGAPGVLSEAGVETLQEIAALLHRPGGRALLQVDGAVSLATRERFLAAGARALVGGYPIFSARGFGAAIAALRHGATFHEPTMCGSVKEAG